MTTALQLRRGTTSQHSTFTGANGEVTIDTTKKTAVVHDGVTPGGTPLAKESDALNKVRFDVSTQGLNDTQKSNARTNIDAAKEPTTNGWIVRTGAGASVSRSLVAGSGISITNVDGVNGDPVISNTGVRSVNGQTGDVTVSVNTGDRVAKTGDTMSGDLLVQGTGLAKLTTSGDIWAYRSGGTTGVVYLNQAGTRYVHFDGTKYQMPGAGLAVNGVDVITTNGAGLAKSGATLSLASGVITAGWKGWSSMPSNGSNQNIAGINVDTYGRVIGVTTNCNCTCC